MTTLSDRRKKKNYNPLRSQQEKKNTTLSDPQTEMYPKEPLMSSGHAAFFGYCKSVFRYDSYRHARCHYNKNVSEAQKCNSKHCFSSKNSLPTQKSVSNNDKENNLIYIAGFTTYGTTFSLNFFLLLKSNF